MAASVALRQVSVAAVLVLGGCHGDGGRPAASVLTSRDCLRAWNAPGNGANRAALLRAEFSAGRLSEWLAVADFGEERTGDSHTTGCSYLFHDGLRYESFSGTWKGAATLVWDGFGATHGKWTPAQQPAVVDDIRVLPRGAIAEIAPCGRAVAAEYYAHGRVRRADHSSCYAWVLDHLPEGSVLHDPRPLLRERFRDARRHERAARSRR